MKSERMLSEKARLAVNLLMIYGCTLQVFPYRWDSAKFRLYRATRAQNRLFNLHAGFMFFYYSFITFRLISTLRDPMPILVRLIIVVWVVAYGLTSSSTIQFYKRRDEIMFFANALFEAKEGQRLKTKGNEAKEGQRLKRKDESADESVSSWGETRFSSTLILISWLLLFTGGPAHAIVLWSGPCNPTYISSVIHNCTSYFDQPLTMLEATPYVLYEYYVIGFVLAVWSFNWTFIFTGWLWIAAIMKETQFNQQISKMDSVGMYEAVEIRYRRCQVLAILLNDAFGIYLRAFPSVLFIMAGLMLFAAIRYTDLPFHLYMVFPSCGLRCLYEATTALAAAGKMHEESTVYLAKLKQQVDPVEDREYRRTFRNSCRTLLCTAGSMYTFENSIVLVSLFNCTLLTFNMLVTYNK